jgi:hypothetical protein
VVRETLSRVLRIYIRENGIGPDDLLFPLSRLQTEWRAANPEPEPVVVVVPDDLGRTEPNARGRTFVHGTMSGYTAGRCPCPWCRRSFAMYRAERRARGPSRSASSCALVETTRREYL